MRSGVMKSHKSAVVIIPPESLWEPIQRLRRRYDRKVRRWMPHITLLYPFRPPELLPEALERLRHCCALQRPFRIALRQFELFRHGRSSFTVWLRPEPAAPLQALQRALEACFPDCTEQSSYPGGFVPHLSVGQFRGEAQAAERFRADLQREWEPIEFQVESIAAIVRGDPPEDVFVPVATIALGDA
jgi:2'-5' RNA ligase